VTVTLDDTAPLWRARRHDHTRRDRHSFRFRADLLVRADHRSGPLLSMAAAVHQLPIETLFSMPRDIDLRADPQLALRTAQACSNGGA